MVFMMLVVAQSHNAGTHLEAAMDACTASGCTMQDPTRPARLMTQLLQQVGVVIMWKPRHVCARDVSVELALFDVGGNECYVIVLVWLIQVWLIQPWGIVSLDFLGSLLFAWIFVVWHSCHITEADFADFPGHIGLVLGRQHWHISHDLVEECTAPVDVSTFLGHVLGRFLFVD